MVWGNAIFLVPSPPQAEDRLSGCRSQGGPLLKSPTVSILSALQPAPGVCADAQHYFVGTLWNNDGTLYAIATQTASDIDDDSSRGGVGLCGGVW